MGQLGALGKAVGSGINTAEHGDPFHPAPPAYRIGEWLKEHADLEPPMLEWMGPCITCKLWLNWLPMGGGHRSYLDVAASIVWPRSNA